MRLTALSLIEPLPPQDFAGEILMLSGFVRDDIRYVGDVYGVETLHTPEAILEIGQGDCDDKALLLASLLMSIGRKCQFCVLERDGAFCHVWTMVYFGGRWIDLETTIPIACGQHAQLRFGDRRHYWPIKAYDYAG